MQLGYREILTSLRWKLSENWNTSPAMEEVLTKYGIFLFIPILTSVIATGAMFINVRSTPLFRKTNATNGIG